MNIDEFWNFVQAADWPGALVDPNIKDPIEHCKGKLFELLPRLTDMWDFRDHFDTCYHNLTDVIGQWQMAASGKDIWNRAFGLSDDGFSDLLAMIIGMGKTEYDAVVLQPERALKRAKAPYGSPEGFTESFAYCIPYRSDYDPVGVKIERAEDALARWVAVVAQKPTESNQKELNIRIEELAALQAQAMPEKDRRTPAQVAELVRAARCQEIRNQIQRLLEQRDEIDSALENFKSELAKLELKV